MEHPKQFVAEQLNEDAKINTILLRPGLHQH